MPHSIADSDESKRQFHPPEQVEAGLLTSKSPACLREAMSLFGVISRYNIRSAKHEYRYEGGDWFPSDDRFTAALAHEIAGKFSYSTRNGSPSPLLVGSDKWREFTNAINYLTQVDPFLDFLREVPEWDGQARLDSLLRRAFGAAPDDALAQWASRYPFVGAIQRAVDPGCKLDEIPILVGAQGIGKSALLRSIFPEGSRFDAWFGDSLDLGGTEKVRLEATLGRVVMELSEMQGSTKAAVDQIKSYVTRRNDNGTRLAYAADSEERPRRFVLVGTTNRSDFIPNDPSGNRRFVPVTLHRGTNIEALLAEERGQLWAEALVMHQFGQRANLPRELMEEAAGRAEGYRNRDHLVEGLVNDLLANGELKTGISLAAVIAMAQRQGGRGVHDRRVAAVLKQCGCVSRQVKRNREIVRLWFEPPNEAE